MNLLWTVVDPSSISIKLFFVIYDQTLAIIVTL